MVNTYGLKMTGLDEVAKESRGLNGPYDAGYLQINYDIKTGEVFSNFLYSLGENSWVRYHDKAIHVIGNVARPCSAQQLADMILNYIAEVACEMKNDFANITRCCASN